MTLRVVVVDDSPFVREILRTRLEQHPDLKVVGEAGDGDAAIRVVGTLRPDVVTMDVVMPLLSGITAIRMIMAKTPTPIVVVSDARGGVDRLMVEAIGAGALDVFVKPSKGFDDKSAAELANVLRTAATARVVRPVSPAKPRLDRDTLLERLSAASIIGIAASTGGPTVLHQLVRSLPSNFKTPIAIVQHTALGFTKPLVSWLGAGAPVPVAIARAGDTARGVLLAPDDVHLEISARGTVVLTQDPPFRSHRPAGTVLLRSLAAQGSRAVGMVFTGMSDDGAAGLAQIEAAGGLAIVEDPRTATIDAMPRAAMAATRGAYVATIAEIAALLRAVRRAP